MRRSHQGAPGCHLARGAAVGFLASDADVVARALIIYARVHRISGDARLLQHPRVTPVGVGDRARLSEGAAGSLVDH